MFEGIKCGLHAELIRDRGFEEAPDSTGLSRHWQRYPDDRIDDYAMSLHHDAGVAYPEVKKSEGTTGGHSLRFELKPGVIARHGVYQPRVPVRQRLEYQGYVWARTSSFDGALTVALEADASDGRTYASARITNVAGDWTKYTFTLRPDATDPNARFAIVFDGQGTVWIDQVSLMPGDARGRHPRGCLRQGQGAAAGVHPLAGRQRRAGLSLALGHRSARRPPDAGSTSRGTTSSSRATSAPTSSSGSRARSARSRRSR